MKTRQVRSDSGAVFEVDPSMLESKGTEEQVDYRASSAPPNLSEIIAPPPRATRLSGTQRIVLASAAIIAFGSAIALARALGH